MPTRYLKPGIRDSELIDSLSPMAEVMFYRLLVTVDDFGRFDARPAMIKSQCFPIKEKTTQKHCEEAIKELCEAGLLMVYVVDQKPFLQVLKWDNVPRSKESKFPAYVEGCMQLYADVCKPRTLLPETVTVTVTKTETKTVNTASPFVLPDWIPSEAWDAFMEVRRTKKAKATPYALSLIVKTLEKIRDAGHDPIDALHSSIRSNWTDVYMPKELAIKPQQSQQKTFAERDREAGMARWEEMTGRVHPDRQKTHQGHVIDVTPPFLELGQ
jgi:hypothetical protein